MTSKAQDTNVTCTAVADLFSPLTIAGVTLKNRIAVSPMCQYSSVDGFAEDWHLVHLGSRAVGGASLVVSEATAVTAQGRITPDCLGIYKDEHIEYLSYITEFITRFGAVPGIQLAHAGRKASTASPWRHGGGGTDNKVDLTNERGGWDIIAPSAIPFNLSARTPLELSIEQIKEVQNAFVLATKRAEKAGFRWIEIHAAHGYLLHSFYSPMSNKRLDLYGGSFENRIRMLVEVVKQVRPIWQHPLAVRISASDWCEGGWTIEDSIQLARVLKSEGVDLIDCSSGFNVAHVKYPYGPGWQVPFAEAIRKNAEIMTGAVGEIVDAKQANEIIRSGKADLVFLAREMMRDPYWPFHAAQKLDCSNVQTLPERYTYRI